MNADLTDQRRFLRATYPSRLPIQALKNLRESAESASICVDLFWIWLLAVFSGTIEDQRYNFIHIIVRQPGLSNQEAHVEGAVESIERQIKVEVFRQFPASNATA